MKNVNPVRSESIQRLRQAFADRTLGAKRDGRPVYSGHGGKKFCAVGVMFSPAQLADIKHRRLNGANIRQLADAIGTKNIETVTGFTVDELAKIQRTHDQEAGWCMELYHDEGDFTRMVCELK